MQSSIDLLEGIRVLDLSQLIAGPSATSMLAELGADVIKLETPAGDTSRRMGQARQSGFSATFAAYNKGKRSLAVDLHTPEGREVVQALVQRCDVLVEAFRPGVADRLGLGYEAVRAIRPDIIYVSFSGFGEDGPMADRPGVDLLIQGESGIMSITGEQHGSPMKIGFTAVDAAAGFALSKAIMAGLIGRLRKGEGCRIRMSLLDVALYIQAVPMAEYLMSGVEPGRTGNKAPLGAPAELFETRDGALIVSAYFPNQWPDLCRLLELDELRDDPSYASNELRIQNREALHDLLQKRMRLKTSAEWKALFAATRIIFGDVLGYGQVAEHAQVQHNRPFTETDVGGGAVKTVVPPLRIDERAPRRLGLPRLGEHTRKILAEIGYGQDTIDRLMESKVVFGHEGG